MSRRRLELNGSLFEGQIAILLSDTFTDSKYILNKSVYSPFLKKDTQIDLIFIRPCGVYIIEAKNWKTYIKGTINSDEWKGKGSGSPMSVRSPLQQNQMHVRALRAALRKNNLEPVVFNSYIVVPDSCQIITDSEEVVTLSKLRSIMQMDEFSQQKVIVDEYYDAIMNV